MNPRTRILVSEFWEFLAFFVNSIVFLLIGDQVRFSVLADNLNIIAVAIVAMIVMRAIAIYLLSSLSNGLAQSEISLFKQIILWWGGLRGSVSIALALSVPAALSEREEIIATVFGVVLFTLLVQGLTTKPLLQRLDLLGDQPMRQQYLEVLARQAALDRVLQHLQTERRSGVDPDFYRYQEALVTGEIKNLSAEIERLQQEHPDLQSFMLEQLRDELFAIEADTYAEFVRKGRLNQELSSLLQDVLQGGDTQHE
jgi:CPA1 family monovalent cation:H+ antiporter